jgi:hypothetical protein
VQHGNAKIMEFKIRLGNNSTKQPYCKDESPYL